MNVNGIQTGGAYSPQWSPPVKEVGKEEILATDLIRLGFQKNEDIGLKEPKPEELVMKPSPVSAEERMSQVISPEQMKDLLSMIVHSRFSANSSGAKLGQRFDQKG
ncbi:hypothetical protein LEP1GSC050_1435 [Leptospira broomii serovar Hurstbridge str. 5399]|uniref:Uncharacterized protein n=1 Tax=Leptospira broomii serovar Hurstbridge str. 5399 TaxID=1049789 RepID=T0G9U0_9LEPT|nr:hypothetical protein [Leptospira broomii]EQA43564.1 hypothetical protein LEP1GSC050_1435 [Leptospira broomii serovar Hurstbridge str. 5399]